MRKAAEYRKHAEECRELARVSNMPEQREQLMKMAEAWEGLATERDRRDGGSDPSSMSS